MNSLILEGGGMRGLYTCGVLDYFLKKELSFDSIIGVSAGACCACSYLSNQFGRGAAVNLNYINDKRYLSISNLLKDGSAFGIDFIFKDIPDQLLPFDYKTFHKNKTVFYAVSTNVETGEAVYKRITNMHSDYKYIAASMSLPLISPFCEVDHLKLLDGGIADSIPIEFSIQKGYQKHIVVLTQYKDYRKGKNNLLPIIKHNYKKYPKLISLLENRHIRYNQTLEQLRKLEKEGKVFIIQPSKPVTISRLERNVDNLKALYDEGYKDAERLYNDLIQFIERD